MAEQENETNETPTPPDYSVHLPDQFKDQEGKLDFEGFRASWDTLTAEKAQSDEALAALPKEASEYAFTLAEGHALPEGFDVDSLTTKDADGNEIKFDPAAMIKSDDPDIALLQGILHEAKVPADVMQKLAGIMVNREIRGLMEATTTKTEELKALGPDNGKARLDTLTRTLNARLDPAQSKALLDSVTSAAGVRALESLVKKGNIAPPADTNTGPDLEGMSARELIQLGLEQQNAKA